MTSKAYENHKDDWKKVSVGDIIKYRYQAGFWKVVRIEPYKHNPSELVAWCTQVATNFAKKRFGKVEMDWWLESCRKIQDHFAYEHDLLNETEEELKRFLP